MRMGLGVRTGLGHGGITCVLQTQFSSFQDIFEVRQLILVKEHVSRKAAAAEHPRRLLCH